jgi:hypothetical protein
MIIDPPPDIFPNLFCLENLSGQRISAERPWSPSLNGARAVPPGLDKEGYRKWCSEPSTHSLFFSGYEGANAALRVSEQNPPQFMHALVADYDAKVAPGEMDAFLKRASPDYPPNMVGSTFSGNARALWLFEAPLPVFDRKAQKAMVARFKKELKLKRLLPGLDEEALERPVQYYHCGDGWRVLHTSLLSVDLLQAWAIQASKNADWGALGETVPLDRVADEVERRFPGRWPGPFEDGARGPRFWDESADSPGAAIIRPSGMQCFTGAKPFVSWSEIFGRKFTDEFRASTIGAAINGTWFDGRDYWLQIGGVWRLFKKADISLHLRVSHSISDERRGGSTASPLDVALEQIHQNRCLDGAAPFVFRRDHLIQFGGKRYLNISRSRIIEPLAGQTEWGDGFPWIADFLAGLFDPDEQLDFFLSWLSYAYRHALAGRPRNGQAIFLAGDVNQGKTLVSNVLIGGLFGGHMDASDYLLGESRFNKELFEVGVWSVDDTVPSSDPKKQQLYSAMLKKIPANYAFQYHPKFRDQIMLPWAGRVVITCNADPESIRILPDVEMSILDKICLFRIRTAERNFTDAADHIRTELPAFGRWLRDYEPPFHCQGDVRFGVRCYHHAALIETARQSGNTAGFIELLERFLRSWFSDPSLTHWTGTATDLLAEMMADESTKHVAAKYTPDQIGRRLGQLKSQSYPIDYGRDTARQRTRTWTIQRDRNQEIPTENEQEPF